jgi:hypothetical protein
MDAIRYALVHIFDLGCLAHLDEVVRMNSPAPGFIHGAPEPAMTKSLAGGDSFFSMGSLGEF